MHNGGVVVHTAYGKSSICCMEKKVLSIQHMDKFSICYMDKKFMSIQHMDKLSICCMEKTFRPYNICTSFLYVVWKKALFPYKT